MLQRPHALRKLSSGSGGGDELVGGRVGLTGLKLDFSTTTLLTGRDHPDRPEEEEEEADWMSNLRPNWSSQLHPIRCVWKLARAPADAGFEDLLLQLLVVVTVVLNSL